MPLFGLLNLFLNRSRWLQGIYIDFAFVTRSTHDHNHDHDHPRDHPGR